MAKVSIIAAVSEDNALGLNNDLLWDIPEDLKNFKNITISYPIIMGRKTFESLGKKPLPGRNNIIITRDKEFQQKGVIVTNSLTSALKIAKKLNRDEVFIIGGGAVYKEALETESVDYIYLTLVHKEFPKADTFFPKISNKKWKKVKESEEMKSKNGLKYTFLEYEKI